MILNLLTAAASLLIRNYNPKFKHKNLDIQNILSISELALMNGQMPRISALVIFCKSDKLQSRWQINPNSVEKKYQNIFCKTIERYFANMLKDILQVGQVAKQVATKPKRY